ncbi:hypothetical protein E2C01_082882 [Portunus trituberculatus]|uniref:Uncharacterized protein n=1 Tax=Portunus trituberculatus TaxID=210409 RepID=A0A5B7J0G4_PORTR|nr:hypothetical protein [Portunus trituberculatus]
MTEDFRLRLVCRHLTPPGAGCLVPPWPPRCFQTDFYLKCCFHLHTLTSILSRVWQDAHPCCLKEAFLRCWASDSHR